MRVAVATSDGVSIAQHFGRSAAWLVFEVEDGQILKKETRSNKHTNHALNGCGDEKHDQPHNHAGILAALSDCEAVLSAGMGWRAAVDLKNNGVNAFVVDHQRTPEEAVALYLEGKARPAQEVSCRGRH